MDKTIYQLIEEQAEHIPDHIALMSENPKHYLTYRQLNQRADQLAHYLYNEKGIRPGQPVAVLMERSMELIISLIGVLKAGGAYVPLDPSLPTDRLRIMFNDASIEIVISRQKFIQKLLPLKNQCHRFHSILPMDDPASRINQHPPIRPGITGSGFPAYVMYTSGSSGTPKGVLVEHRTIVNTLLWRKNYYDYQPGDVSLRNPPYFFDSSVTDIFTPLLGGARLLLTPEEEKTDLTVLKRLIPLHNVSHFIAVPAFYNILVEEIPHALTHVKHICVAGEHFPDRLIRKHFDKLPHVRISNEYGPTENSVNSTAYEIKPGSPKALIGKPISNVSVYILDRWQCLSPVGVTGEICLAGSSLTRGYLNNPELTAEKFNKDFQNYQDLKPHSRFYRTGDMARWLEDGNLEFIGRTDTQVKIRGIRVEIEEIENHLMQCEGIKEAIVLAHSRDGAANEKYLCAYYIPVEGDYVPVKPGIQLKLYLSGKLPQHMVPSYFVPIDKIPFTPGGKIDRKLLPAPGVQDGTHYTSPRDEVETKLVEIWSGLLGKPRENGAIAPIGIDDDFFSIGGDSIKAIQILSRITNAGYKTDMRTLFEYPTIRELAPRLTPSDTFTLRDQSPVTGSVPLSPIQESFFRGSPLFPNHFNQSVMFLSVQRLDVEMIKAVFNKIREHHDALRMTYKRNNDMGNRETPVTQTNHGLDSPFVIGEFDFRGHPYEEAVRLLEAKAQETQEGIDLEKGPLMKPVLFHLDDGSRLLIVIHHLVIDGVSWRILFEDIRHLMPQYENNEPLELPLKTDSFKTWAEKLRKYAAGEELLKEKHYWEQLLTQPTPQIEHDFKGGSNRTKEAVSLPFRLSESQTETLLKSVNHAYGTEINDILLTALGLAVKETWGHNRFFIALEGHGRENLFEDIDISRTVGWFTSEYPVLIEVPDEYEDDPGRPVKEVKETLRRVPNKGIGYGILEYLTTRNPGTEPPLEVRPRFSFNYLGQFDADVRQTGLQIAPEAIGRPRNENEQRNYELAVSGIVSAGRLTVNIEYGKKQYKARTIRKLSSHFESRLLEVIRFCAAKEKREFTPSDFTYPHLPIETVDRLNRRYPDAIQDLYLLTPMQQGMLFHALIDKPGSSESYFEQISYRLHGVLDPPIAEDSLNELFNRHDVLRTAFIHKGVEVPLQLVLKERRVDFHYEDISPMGGNPEKEQFIQDFKSADRRRSFNLSRDVLLRAAIFKLDENQYEFLWSNHHILMDGWCSDILISEFLEIYTRFLENKPHRLPPVTPYRTYIKWLGAQKQENSGDYWKIVLDSYDETVGLPLTKSPVDKTVFSNQTLRLTLDPGTVTKLNDLAGGNNVTLNSIIQAMWAILLGLYNSKKDIVFGSVVSGRPAQLEGVETMVGLFINTIPVRIRFARESSFKALIRGVQAHAIASLPHHYYPLAKIQAQSFLKQELIDHILVFESLAVNTQLQGYENKNQSPLTLSNVDVFEQTNYDFNLAVRGGTEKELVLKFNFNGNVFDGDFIRRLAGHFHLLVKQVIENEAIEVGQLTLLTDSEKRRLLVEFNDTRSSYPKDKVIPQLFEEQATKTPDRIALEMESRCLTYDELNRRSNRLARFLQRSGVKPGSIVGILLNRSLQMIISVFAVLKAGGIFLNLDPNYPEERIDYMLRDSGVKVIVTNGLKVDWLDGLIVIKPGDADEFPNQQTNKPTNQQTNLAYIIYTSGSTGTPKGVIGLHRGMVNRFNWMWNAYPFKADDVCCQKTSMNFVDCMWETFGPL
ncbi:MAG: amino acid adenylation domain-containing protein, partial [bacterium]|nr:amino acid adenylation domain-containing protein [bacterium]